MVNQLVCITLDEILASPRLKVTKIAPPFLLLCPIVSEWSLAHYLL